MSALDALLNHVVDYAGLFPPAELDMESAVRNYQDALAGENGWMLGSFVLPAARLGVFAETFERVCCGERERPWTLSVVCPAEADRQTVEEFREGAVFIRAMETKAGDAASAEAALRGLPESRECYVEFAPERAGEILPVLAEHGGRAKLRTGGLTAAAIPSVEAVAGFLRACAAARVPLKATAGLHHPVRGLRVLSREGAARATMHGFVNLLLAAALAWYGADEAEVAKTLSEEEPQAFAPDEDAIRWHGNAMTVEQLEPVREQFAVSFGSCSFQEPVDELTAMGWL